MKNSMLVAALVALLAPSVGTACHNAFVARAYYAAPAQFAPVTYTQAQFVAPVAQYQMPQAAYDQPQCDCQNQGNVQGATYVQPSASYYQAPQGVANTGYIGTNYITAPQGVAGGGYCGVRPIASLNAYGVNNAVFVRGRANVLAVGGHGGYGYGGFVRPGFVRPGFVRPFGAFAAGGGFAGGPGFLQVNQRQGLFGGQRTSVTSFGGFGGAGASGFGGSGFLQVNQRQGLFGGQRTNVTAFGGAGGAGFTQFSSGRHGTSFLRVN